MLRHQGDEPAPEDEEEYEGEEDVSGGAVRGLQGSGGQQPVGGSCCHRHVPCLQLATDPLPWSHPSCARGQDEDEDEDDVSGCDAGRRQGC